MDQPFRHILTQQEFTHSDLLTLIQSEGDHHVALMRRAEEVQTTRVGNKIYFRGLIEFSNRCIKDCLYCGIRKSNLKVNRFELDAQMVLDAADFAWKNGYGSIVLQAGEQTGRLFVNKVEKLLHQIKEKSCGELGITLSLGEQEAETYRRWKNSGADRYLLRIETSNPDLYGKIHPHNRLHHFSNRIQCLNNLKALGYQTGTGVMIGLPFQTFSDLARDLLFFKEMEVDMVGMGPYLEHEETPLHAYRNTLWTQAKRLEVAFNMIASLRLLMPDINIAASTALQAIDPMGREKALKGGANVMMPNITPSLHRKDYSLYEHKPCTDEGADDCANCMRIRVDLTGRSIGYYEKGDSIHYKKLHSQNN